MQQVLDAGSLITVEQYIQKYPNALLNAPNYHPPLMTCPHCMNPGMQLRARSSVSVVPYFAHPQNAGFCPSKENKDGVYLGHRNPHPDLANAEVLKDDFRHNWKFYFKKIKTLVPFLRVKEFTKLIDIANNERIWEYRNVQPYHIPYLFVTLADFPVQKPDAYHESKYCRCYYFRYWFNSGLNNYGDIINNLNGLSLCRASYKLYGKERIPNTERLSRIENIVISNDLKQQDIKDIPEFIVTWVDRYFKINHWHA